MNRSYILNIARDDLNADFVSIDTQRIQDIAWPADDDSGMSIELPWCDASNSRSALEFLVVMDSLNFRFWDVNGDSSLRRYKRGTKSGARALWGALEEYWGGDSGIFFQRLKSPEIGFERVFGDMPFPEQRIEILESIEASGRLAGLCRELCLEITRADKVRVEHASALAQAFPLAFDDPYLKKAQLAISMFAGYLRSVEHRVDTSDLVAFADYQVPRVLRALGVLRYSPALAALVDDGTLIDEDSAPEKAIRAATIVACEQIAEATGASAADVDNWLWQAQEVAGNTRFHLTLTTRY
jgi:hypothetical protein